MHKSSKSRKRGTRSRKNRRSERHGARTSSKTRSDRPSQTKLRRQDRSRMQWYGSFRSAANPIVENPMVQVFGNQDIVALILRHFDNVRDIVTFLSTMSSLRADVQAFHERVEPLIRPKLLEQEYCDDEDYILAVNLRRVYSYAEFRKLILVNTVVLYQHRDTWNFRDCGENSFDVEQLRNLNVLPDGMTEHELIHSNGYRRDLRRREHKLRLCVFGTLLRILENIDSFPCTIHKYHFEFVYNTHNYGVRRMHVNEVGAAYSGRDQPRFTQIVNAICLICKLCTQLEITFVIHVLDLNDYNRFEFTQFQKRIMDFLDVESTRSPRNYTVTLHCTDRNLLLRAHIEGLPRASQSKFPNFRYVPSEDIYVIFERVYNRLAGPSSNNGSSTSQLCTQAVRGLPGPSFDNGSSTSQLSTQAVNDSSSCRNGKRKASDHNW